MRKGGATGVRPFHPPANRDSYKDVLIFEERLKQNFERLQKQRRKYQSFLLTLVSIIGYLTYLVLLKPSIYSLVHYSNVACLLVAATTLILFFATGMYQDKISYAYKFVPQANRAMRPFNIYLNTKRPKSKIFNHFFSSSPPTTTTTPTPTRPLPATLSRQTSTSSFRSTTALRSTTPSPNNSPPPSPTSSTTGGGGIPIPPIPPAQNPRGELIFSNRVNPNFREGYERYRGEWERRRKETKELQRRQQQQQTGGGGGRWSSLLSNIWKRNRRRSLQTEEINDKKEQEEVDAVDKQKRGRRIQRQGEGSADSSRMNSRTNSRERRQDVTPIPPPSSTISSSSSSSLAPLDSNDPSSTSTPPPQSEPESSIKLSTNLSKHNHSRIRAESFSELLELEAQADQEDNMRGCIDCSSVDAR